MRGTGAVTSLPSPAKLYFFRGFFNPFSLPLFACASFFFLFPNVFFFFFAILSTRRNGWNEAMWCGGGILGDLKQFSGGE